jgi:hypothetical protein
MGQETDKKAKHELEDEQLDKVSGGRSDEAKHVDPNERRIDNEHLRDNAARIK